MNLGGWLIMLFSVGGTTAFLLWCFAKVFTTPESEEHLHSQADIEPPDVKE